MRTLKIAKHDGRGEIFLSVQGEGRHQGTPSVFVRTSLCNLHCVWCDTDYTWNWAGTPYPHEKDGEPGYAKFEKSEEIIEMTPAEIVAAVRTFDCRHIVLTGGEPLLQQAGLIDVISLLRDADTDAGYHIEVETNGTLAPNPAFDASVDQYNVSPKLSNAYMEASLRIKADVSKFFASSEKAWFKFVVDREEDISEVLAMVRTFEIKSSRVYLMPQGRSADALTARQAWVEAQCAAHGFKFSDRLHVHEFGDRRGV